MDYKEKQKKYKDMYKMSGKYIWLSKEPGDLKGRTYINEDKKNKKKGGKKNDNN